MTAFHHILRIFLLLISLCGFLLFFLPAITYRIINIGNITGMCIFAVLIFYLLKFSAIHSFLGKTWNHPAGKIALILLAILFLLGICLFLYLSFLMNSGAKRAPSEDATVVVLGCKVKGETASLMLTERLDAAYDYLCEHPDASCVLSGGQGEDENISEAECMYRYLIEKGISSDRLYQENQSTSTRENLAFSMELIETEHLNPEIAIITNEFHEYRAYLIADSLGLKSGAIPAKTVWWLFPTYAIRELYGILYQQIF